MEQLLSAKMKLADEEAVAWASRTVMRLQKRRTIVGRERRVGPVPDGWEKVASRSRPGGISYFNTVTGARTSVRPTEEAGGLEPLPKGWFKLPSNRWTGRNVYMHPARPALHLGWRPKPIDYEHPERAPDAIEGDQISSRKCSRTFFFFKRRRASFAST